LDTPAVKQRTTRRRLAAVVVGLASSGIFLALSLRRIDLGDVGHMLVTAQWWPWYVLAPVIYMAGHFVRGVRCRRILRPHAELSTWDATNIVITGYGANNVLPARMGELVRAYMLTRVARVSLSLSLAITFLERFLDGLVITGILVVAGVFMPLPEWGRRLLWVASAVFLTALLGVVLVMAAKPLVLRVVRAVTARFPAAVGTRLTSIVDRAIGATDCLRDAPLAAQIVLLSAAVWLVEGGMFLVILPAFGVPANPLWAALALSVTNLGILFPSSPGYIGPFHYFCMQALLMVGVARETALGYAIMAHLLYYVPVTVWGLSALAVYGIDLTTAARAADGVKPVPLATAVTPK
jgi:glycosyltransferase 2 family protein